jgi:HK97 family phage prohead protease
MDIRFAGYASVFGVPDKGGDVVAPGAFSGLPDRVPLLWQHDSREPIGFADGLGADQRGLRVTGHIIGSGRGQQASDLVLSGALTGLSFGYRVKSARADRLRGVRELTGLELIEISLVTFPMQPLARVLAAVPVTPEETNP